MRAETARIVYATPSEHGNIENYTNTLLDWHWDNMLCNALDGSEDDRGRGEASRMWDQLGMTAKRAAAVSDVEVAYAAG